MLEIKPMTSADIAAVLDVEEACFSTPWTKADFEREVHENAMAIYRVAFYEGKIVGYAGMWHVVTEGHITNVAVLPEYRRYKIGEALLLELIAVAQEKEMIGITLEVRIGNSAAQKLYTKHGFRPEGFRKRYYVDTGEDAVIMWKYFPWYENYEETL